MAYDARIFRVLIASPSDVAEERDILTRAIQEWNDLNSFEKSVVLLPLMWETHSSPELGDRPQAIINRQLVDSCDMLVGVFWTRLGTPTGKAASGTIEEIERVGNAGKPVMLYFSKIKVEIDSVDLVQYQKLKDFKYRTYPKGLIESYSSLLEFRDKFSKQLAMKVRELVSRDAERRNSEADSASDPNRPLLELALVRASTEDLFRSGSDLELQAVVCNDIGKMEEALLGKGHAAKMAADSQRVPSEEEAYVENRVAYLRELVEHYCLERSLEGFRLAIINEGELGVRHVILEIELDDCSGQLRLFSADSQPAKPRRPRAPREDSSYVISSGRDVIISNVYGADARDIALGDVDDGWEIKFTVPVIQPKRTVVSNGILSLGAKSACLAEFRATVFSSKSTPFKLRGEFSLSVSAKEISYVEVLKALGEDLSGFPGQQDDA